MQARLEKQRLKAIFDLWLDHNTYENLPFIPLKEMAEIRFQVPITDTIVYCGAIDLLAQMKSTGHAVVVDIKTTRSMNRRWLRKWAMDTQVSGYVYAAKQHMPQVLGMIIGVIELPDPKVSKSKCKVHGVPYTECDLFHANFHWIGPILRSDAQLESWRRTMVQQARRYSSLHKKALDCKGKKGIENVLKLPQEGMFTEIEYVNSCVSCELSNFCEADRPTHMASNYLAHQPWFCFPEMIKDMPNPLAQGEPNA